ncbi:MAG: hypothetical protein ACJ798_04525 [Phenylobacterium sp.]
MRAAIFALALAAGLGAAAAAAAQTSTPSYMTTPLPQNTGEYNNGLNFAGPGDGYEFKLMMLKKKMDRITRQDGGQLTPEHEASLQAELDKLNGAHRKMARR